MPCRSNSQNGALRNIGRASGCAQTINSDTCHSGGSHAVKFLTIARSSRWRVIVYRKAVAGRLLAVVYVIISDDVCDAQAIIGKDLGAAFGLCRAMGGEIAPGLYRLLVAEKRQRQHLARFGKAFKALNGNKPIDCLKQRPQRCCNVQVVLLAVRLRPDFEDNRDHLKPPRIEFENCWDA